MLVSRLLLRAGVDVVCERSFLVRCGSVPFVRVVGVGLRFGTVTCSFLMVLSVLVLFCGRLAARCPGCHEWWGRWSSVMSGHAVWRCRV